MYQDLCDPFLSPARLPFRHSRLIEKATDKSGLSQATAALTLELFSSEWPLSGHILCTSETPTTIFANRSAVAPPFAVLNQWL